jgi:sporulation protein YlmC with PRC-barrel domain
MLRSLKDLEGYGVSAKDGDLGSVADFLLDDEGWACRYLVVNAGGFFMERDLLISPVSFRQVDWDERLFHLDLTRAKIEASPSVDTELPVSRQHERDYFRYYGYPNYWGSSGVWGLNQGMTSLARDRERERNDPRVEDDETGDDVHLRSARFLRGYHVQGSDEEIGHIEDFIIDDETWQIRYLVVNTSNWWVGKKVLIAPFWAYDVSWEASMVYLDLTRHEIQNSPEWDPEAPVNRAYEERLFDYYGRPVYWDQPGPKPTPAEPAAPVSRLH